MPDADTLATALIRLQSKLPRITKDDTAQVGPRTYAYANLATIHDAVLPLLGECGLAWICRPTLVYQNQTIMDAVTKTPVATFVLAYALKHAASGEQEYGEYPLPATGTPQQIGSAITYARRYCLTAVLGIAPAEDDDDGQAASDPPPQWHPPANPRTRKAQRSSGKLGDDEWTTDADPDADTPGSITEAQANRLRHSFERANIWGQKDRLAYAMSALDLPELASSNDLSMRQAGELIAKLESEVQQ